MLRSTSCALVASLLFAACGGGAPSTEATASESSAASATTAASASGARTTPPPAAAGAARVALVANEALVLSEAAGETWVVGAKSGKVAKLGAGGALEAAPALTGLPLGEATVARVQGRLPGSQWVTLHVPDPEKKHDRSPIYRWFKSGWREIAPDWNPEIASWSKNRMLAASTSSGKLKIKIVEPQAKKSPADIPGRAVGDETCQKSFKLRELAALTDGTVFGVGRCTVGKKASYVAVRWLVGGGSEREPAPKASAHKRQPKHAASASAGASASASAAPSAGAETSAPAASGAPTASAGPASSEPQPLGSASSESGDDDVAGVPAVLDVIGPDVARHRSLILVSAKEAYVAGADNDEGSSAKAWRLDVDRWSALELPAWSGAFVGLARSADGTLWGATRAELWRKPAQGTWEKIALASDVAGEAASGWELSEIRGAADAVLVTARATVAGGERRVVLALGAGAGAKGPPLRWE